MRVRARKLLSSCLQASGFVSYFLLLRVDAFGDGPPNTPKRPVSDVYHGVSVVDDYRWLEHIHNPEVKTWVAQQNGYSRSILDKIKTKPIVEQGVADFYHKRTTNYSDVIIRATRGFALKSIPSQQQSHT